jgi:hypothetical protein
MSRATCQHIFQNILWLDHAAYAVRLQKTHNREGCLAIRQMGPNRNSDQKIPKVLD